MAASSSPCCVECGAPVPSIVQRLGADSVRLARCESCGHVADKYAEFEPTLIVIDLLLYRPSAYRHVLINRQVLRGREEHEALLEAGITLLSIAHRPEVRRFHHVELQLAGDGSGAWSLVPLVAREETV